MRARIRDPEFLDHLTIGSTEPSPKTKAALSKQKQTSEASSLSPLLVLFGSNTGTCEALGQSLASSAEEHGFSAEVKSMDSASGALKREVPVAIITATYEGQPPDNAAHFVEWLTASDSPDVKDIRFAVFGVGNSKSFYYTAHGAL